MLSDYYTYLSIDLPQRQRGAMFLLTSMVNCWDTFSLFMAFLCYVVILLAPLVVVQGITHTHSFDTANGSLFFLGGNYSGFPS